VAKNPLSRRLVYLTERHLKFAAVHRDEKGVVTRVRVDPPPAFLRIPKTNRGWRGKEERGTCKWDG